MTTSWMSAGIGKRRWLLVPLSVLSLFVAGQARPDEQPLEQAAYFRALATGFLDRALQKKQADPKAALRELRLFRSAEVRANLIEAEYWLAISQKRGKTVPGLKKQVAKLQERLDGLRMAHDLANGAPSLSGFGGDSLFEETWNERNAAWNRAHENPTRANVRACQTAMRQKEEAEFLSSFRNASDPQTKPRLQELIAHRRYTRRMGLVPLPASTAAIRWYAQFNRLNRTLPKQGR